MDYVKDIQLVMNVLAGLCPRVDQYATLTQPIAFCVNKLADVRDSLNKPTENAKAEEKED